MCVSSSLQTKFIKIIIFCAVFITSLYAQTAVVSGKVVDETDNAIQDVQVVTADGHTTPVFTDAEGKYQITVPAGKPIELDFINLSYKISAVKITPKANEKIIINPKMVFKNAFEDVTVTDENRKQETILIQPKDYFKLAGPNPDISKIILSQGLGVQSSN